MNTPRTDAWAQRVCLNWDGRGDCSREVVFADTARQLETELAEVTKERDALKDELQHYVDEGLIIKEDEDGL